MFYHSVDHLVEPSSSFYVIQACNNDMKLFVEIHVKLLNHARVWCNLGIRASIHYKLGSCGRFELSHIMFPE